MRRSFFHLWVAVGLMFLVGCDEGVSAPGAEASLREVLMRPPEEVAAFPRFERQALADRIEEVMRTQREASRFTPPGEPSTPEVATSYDAPRLLRGDEALLLLRVDPVLDAAVLPEPAFAIATLEAIADDAGVRPLPDVPFVVVGAPDDAPVELPRRVLYWLNRLVEGRDVTEVVLSPSMPAAALADEERVYLNPVWLALLAEPGAAGEVGVSSAALTDPSVGLIGGPVEHHRTSSTGYGCYADGCMSGWFGGSCRCGYCGCDCGECACETGDGADGIHCAAGAHPERIPSPTDPIWIVFPVAYLAWRRRRG